MFKKTILGIIAFILVFGSGILLGKKLSSKQITLQSPQNIAVSKDKTEAQAPISPNLYEGIEIKSAFGTIQSVSNGIITLKINPADSAVTKGADTLTVHTDSSTKFFQFVSKDQAQVQKEMVEFQKQIQDQQQAFSKDPSALQTPLVPPMPQDKKEISTNDIKQGQQISIFSNDNIRDKKEFVASEVDVQSIPETLAAPASMQFVK